MRYLITGGAGFIGSHLADALLARGDSVVVIDDLSTGSIRNIEHLKGHPRFRYLIDTMMNAPLLAELVDGVDQVFHLAAAVGVQLVVDSPVRTIETNLGCTELLLAVAEKKKRKVLIASTFGGLWQELPTCRSARTATWCSVPRREGDGRTPAQRPSTSILAIAYWKEKHLPSVIARFFNTVGPRQTGRYGMVVPRFVGQALRGVPLTVFGDGTQSRLLHQRLGRGARRDRARGRCQRGG